MPNSNETFTFYTDANPPEKWTILDLLYWVSAQVLPISNHDYDGVESRTANSTLEENPLGFGVEVASRWIEDEEAAQIGLSPDPERIAVDRALIDDTYVTDSEHLRKLAAIEYVGNDEKQQAEHDAFIAKQKSLIPAAEEHERLKEKWNLEFDDALDQFRSRLLLAFQNGEIVAYGLPVTLNPVDAQNIESENSYEAFIDALPQGHDMKDALIPIPTNWWIHRRVDWHGAYLREGNEFYLAAQVLMKDALILYPPKERGGVQTANGGRFIFTAGNSPSAKRSSRAGRPSKRWDAVHVQIAKILQRDGTLPSKQDALAQELCDWYEEKFSDRIGLSTVKAKLSAYYADSNFQKSRNVTPT